MLAIDPRSTGIVLALLQACSPAPRPSQVESEPTRDASATWIYEVRADAGARELSIEASLPAGPGAELTVEASCRDCVRDVEFSDAQTWTALEAGDGAWILPARAKGCRVRYRFLLAQAARESGDVSLARAVGGAIEAPPSTWLLRPVQGSPGIRLRFHVTSAPGESFVTGVFPVAGVSDTYQVDASVAGRLPYSAFGDLRVREIEAGDHGGGQIVAAILPGQLASEDDVLEWIRTSARAVAGYYGKSPLARLAVLVRPSRGSHVGFGTTMGCGGASIAIDVGERTTRSTLRDDWVHLLGPQHWFEEGLATYIEPLARAQAGIVLPEKLWSEWVHGMPNGLPEAGDQGLDHTHTWGRTYWGGALFCLLADLEIRERTQGGKSLRDALRGVLDAGGDITVRWPIDRVIEVGDAAVGVPVLRELYDRMKDAPVETDLAAIWKRLGVEAKGLSVAFDDSAPLAGVRLEMTKPRSR